MVERKFRNAADYGIYSNGKVYSFEEMHEAYMSGELNEDERWLVEDRILNNPVDEKRWDDLTFKYLERLRDSGTHSHQPCLRLAQPED